MPYNGSDGTFTLSDTIAPSTLADATELQAILTDIQDGLTAAVAKDGTSTLTGPVKGSNGTQALPAFTFAADPDTGAYRVAANTIGISGAGRSPRGTPMTSSSTSRSIFAAMSAPRPVFFARSIIR